MDGSRPGARGKSDSENVLALVIEGGGMRGVVSAGMVTALDQLGLRDSFDLVIGTSAGAMNGAWFLSGKPGFGTSLYYEDLIGKDWVDFKRVLRRKPVIGLDYLMDTLMTEVKELDTAAVLASPIPLYAVAARLPDFDVSILSDFTSGDELRDALRASARIPVASGRPVQIAGAELLDGSMASSIPAETAVETLGATHIVALLTRPIGELRGKPTLMQRSLFFPLLNRMVPGLGDATARRAPRYAAELRYLNGLENALVVQLPGEAAPIRQLDQNPNALFAAAAAGAAEVYRTFTGRPRRFYPGLTLYPE